jgi:hypothetical protein
VTQVPRIQIRVEAHRFELLRSVFRDDPARRAQSVHQLILVSLHLFALNVSDDYVVGLT